MTSVCVIEIKVADMELGRKFYTEKLGWKVKTEAYLPNVLVMEHDGVDMILHVADKPIEIDYPHSAQSLLIFQTEDAEAAHADLTAKGVDVLEPVHESPPGWAFPFKDPFGNVHMLMQLKSNG